MYGFQRRRTKHGIFIPDIEMVLSWCYHRWNVWHLNLLVNLFAGSSWSRSLGGFGWFGLWLGRCPSTSWSDFSLGGTKFGSLHLCLKDVEFPWKFCGDPANACTVIIQALWDVIRKHTFSWSSTCMNMFVLRLRQCNAQLLGMALHLADLHRSLTINMKDTERR